MYETRRQGVTIPQGQLVRDENLTPNTLLNIFKVDNYPIEYVDEFGRKRITVAVVGGGHVYIEENGEQWASRIREATPKMAEAVMRAIASMGSEVPKQDAVDVVAKMVHEEILNADH